MKSFPKHAIIFGMAVYIFGKSNPDWNCPMEGGAFIPDCGSIAKLIEASTGRFPEFFGKPSKHTLDYIIQETGYEPDEIAIVGDRLYTDIAVADQSDVMSILVLSGESTREDVKTSDVKPNVILEDLSEITKMLITQKGHGMITTSSVSNFILKNIIKILIAKL